MKPNFLVAQIFDDEAVFDSAKVRTGLPLPAEAEMRLRQFVNKDDAARVRGVGSVCAAISGERLRR